MDNSPAAVDVGSDVLNDPPSETGGVAALARTAAPASGASPAAASGVPASGVLTNRVPARRAVDVAVPAALAGAVAVALGVLHVLLDRPLWYDEIWRPHFLAEPAATFWDELAHANTPSALGWAALTRLVGDVAGWHAWALRGPELVALVLLPAAVYGFTRRFAGQVAAGLAAASVGLSGVVVDLGTQLKPYSVEALASVAIVWLWTGGSSRPVVSDGAAEPWRRALATRTAAGLVSLFSVPAAFLIIPLAAADVLGAGRGRRPGPAGQLAVAKGPGGLLSCARRPLPRESLTAALAAAPALVICGLHTALFVAHQSSQRESRFWDTQFLAGRGPLGAVRFVAGEVVRILGGAPTGVDRYDPNLVHPATDTTIAAGWFIAPATAVAVVAGAVVLTRRRDGRRLLAAVIGALVLALVASAGRYWPFGANRTNLFLVPLLAVVVATGADDLARRVLRSRSRRSTVAATTTATVTTTTTTTPPPSRSGGLVAPAVLSRGWRVLLVGVLVVLAATPVASASALAPLWRERAQVRPVALTVDATTLARRLYQPGDVVVVGGRLARSGWLYAMDVSDDGPYLLPPEGAPGRVGPRLPQDSTIFLTQVGAGEALKALAARQGPPPGRILLFVLVYDRSGLKAELADLAAAGWCPAQSFDFPGTGALNVLSRCP